MPELIKRPLGTSRDQTPVQWVVHKTGSYLLGELFGGSYYRECLKMAKAMGSQHRPALTSIHNTRQSKAVDLERMISHLEDVSRWAAQVESEEYHTVNTHAFITLWAAQEAGVENIVAEIVRTSDAAAKVVSERFANGKYSLSSRPWSESVALDIANKLDTKAKNSVDGGGDDLAKRITTLFSWFGLDIHVDSSMAYKYNEASMVRNVILHRYGQLSARDVANFPELSPWLNEVLPITTQRLTSYYDAIAHLHLGIARAIWLSSYK